MCVITYIQVKYLYMYIMVSLLVLLLYFMFLVKIWVFNVPHSVGIVNAEANVCSVRFHPASRYYLAYGCAGNVM